MRIEQQNMFTGEFEVVHDDVADAELKAKLYWLSLEPFECPTCEESVIDPNWGEFYDEEEDRVYEYYCHYCRNCGLEEYVDQAGKDITDIVQKYELRSKKRKEYEKLYDRRLGNL
jgi:hypothetical protein